MTEFGMCATPSIPPDLLPQVEKKRQVGGKPFSRAAMMLGKKWPMPSDGGPVTLRVAFVQEPPRHDLRSKIEQYAKEWSTYANVDFQFGSDSSAEIRIAFQPTGHYSSYGTDSTSAPGHSMNYNLQDPSMQTDAYLRGVVLHEFGHALGLMHEHQSPMAGIRWKPDRVLQGVARWGGNWTNPQFVADQILTPKQAEPGATAYDRNSIMIYPIARDWVEDPSFEVERQLELSEHDKEFIARMYPGRRPKKPENVEIRVGETKEGSIGRPGEIDVYVFKVETKDKYVIETEGPTDVVIALFGPDSDARLIDEADNTAPDAKNAYMVRDELETGTYYVKVWHFDKQGGTGSYRITVR